MKCATHVVWPLPTAWKVPAYPGVLTLRSTLSCMHGASDARATGGNILSKCVHRRLGLLCKVADALMDELCLRWGAACAHMPMLKRQKAALRWYKQTLDSK